MICMHIHAYISYIFVHMYVHMYIQGHAGYLLLVDVQIAVQVLRELSAGLMMTQMQQPLMKGKYKPPHDINLQTICIHNISDVQYY